MGFVVLFAGVLGTGGALTLFTRPLSLRLILVLPYLVVALTIATSAGAILGWRNRYWSLWGRIHQTALAILGAGLSWQLATLGFLP